jgi:hypothetical protein
MEIFLDAELQMLQASRCFGPHAAIWRFRAACIVRAAGYHCPLEGEVFVVMGVQTSQRRPFLLEPVVTD